MSLITVTNIKVGNNFCNVTSPLVFQIEFECCEDLKNDVEWKIIYVTSDGSGYEKESHDESADPLLSNSAGEIVLDAVCLGPLYRGILEFEFRVNAPDFSRMKASSIMGMQAILVTGSYLEQEFIRIGYYTNNCYEDETLRENPPDVPDLTKLVRCIIEHPRVTRFPIRWDSPDLLDHEGNKLDCSEETDKPEKIYDEQSDGSTESETPVENRKRPLELESNEEKMHHATDNGMNAMITVAP
ncbi:bifunctional Histone chaperone ASF1-like superfamily/Histone chaperone ASF1-like/Histone deposition protein Asf1 [Babesia duncani]|uniref:Bifunctional Histone chaperone ASF1-like superfamily/Histone chaperone ASF1-like/Histone deposition protein Asf1 n=1 Tax=Babesia duncani TaxID=323732 RepID=A0AAD9PI70_9APIC|nr:bifunctional Histone chaperone ASF1-like superfamily/Histone chaperone ASF1-like/Histone deposition protein Asf1 [Babesia duncani]